MQFLRKAPWFAGILTLVGMLGLSGCQDKGGGSRYYIRNGDSSSKIRVVVVPFENVSKEADAGRMITNAVITYLLSTGLFEVIEPGIVDRAAAEQRIRFTSGVDGESMAALNKKLRADLFVVGAVEEYGEVRVGSDSYPAVAISARLVDAYDGTIIWAGAVSKTGADSVKIFDIGRVSSVSRLSRMAVEAMATSMLNSRKEILAAIQSHRSMEAGPTDSQKAPGVQVVPAAENAAGGSAASSSSGSNETFTPPTNARYLDESAQYVNGDMKALLIELPGLTRGEVRYTKHAHATVEADYLIGSGPLFLTIRLVDYTQVARSEKMVAHYNPEATPGKVLGLTAYSGETAFGQAKLDVVVGRFGLYVTGPKSKREEIGKAAEALIRSLQ